MKFRKKDSSNKPKLSRNLRRTIKDSIMEFKNDWRIYFLTAAIVFIPSSFVRQYTASSSGANDYSLVLFLVAIMGLLALFWRVRYRSSKKQRIRELYVLASRRYLPFLLISVIIGVLLIPFTLGFLLVFLTAAAGQSILFLLGGVLVIALCVYVSVRLSLSIVAVVDEKNNWRAGIKLAWKLSKGRVWYLTWAYLIYFIGIGLGAGLIISLTAIIPIIGTNSFFTGLVNGLVASVTIPLLVIYFSNLFDNLNSSHGQNQS